MIVPETGGNPAGGSTSSAPSHPNLILPFHSYWWNLYFPGTSATDTVNQQSPPTTGYDPNAWFNTQMAAMRQQLQAQMADDAASAKAAIGRLLVQGGFDFNKKEVRQSIGFGNTGATSFPWSGEWSKGIEKANAAGLTQKYRIDTANTDAKRQIVNNLAGRGMLRSGETGYTLGRQNTVYTQAQNAARQQILDSIASIMAGFRREQRALAAQQAG